jgi:isoamylase
VWIYKTAKGAQPVVRYVMTKDAATSVWSKTASVATLKNSYGTDRYGLLRLPRLGPELAVQQRWVKGSSTGFISDVDPQGNRFNPNKLLLDPYAREISHDPNSAGCTDGTIYASGASHRTKDSGPVRTQGHRAGRTDQFLRHQADARAERRHRLRGARPRPDHERHQRAAPHSAAPMPALH